jgi:hypothetical protein
MEQKKIRWVIGLLIVFSLWLGACGEKKKPESAKAPEVAPFIFEDDLCG